MDIPLPVIHFLFEAGILSKTPRSGFHFLGTGEQSVAEHIFRVVLIGYTLSSIAGDVETGKVLSMCLLHDIAEARTSDLNYVHQKYVTSDEIHAIEDLTTSLPFGNDIHAILHEYKERKSKEAILAKDADNLEWILSLKEQIDIGNTRAEAWLPPAVKRLTTDIAKEIAEKITTTNADSWFLNPNDPWLVNRDPASLATRF